MNVLTPSRADAHDPARSVAAPRETAAVGSVEARVVLAVVHAGAAVLAVVVLLIAAYPAFIKFSLPRLADLGTPWRLGKELEFLLYFGSFGVLLPLSLLSATWHARALEKRGLDAVRTGVVNAAWLAASCLAARAILSGAPPVVPGDVSRQEWIRPISFGMLASLGVLCAVNALILVRPPRLLRGVRRPGSDIIVATATAIAGALVFVPQSAFSPLRLVPAAAVAVVLYAAWRALSRFELRPRAGKATEVALVVGTALLVWNAWLVDERPFRVMAHYWNVHLGPVSAVLHGGTALVDVFPQYGAGTTYVLAGLFELFPIGYGTFALVLAAAEIPLFLALYAAIRLGGASRLLAAAGVAGAALTAVYTKGLLDNPFLTMEGQRSLRFFFPMLAIVLVQLRDRASGRRARVLDWSVAGVVGFTSVWGTEVLFYSLGVVLAATLCRARLDAPAGRFLAFGALRRELGRLAVGLVAAQAVFTAATWLAAGELPNWPQYLQYFSYYSRGSVAHTIPPFGPGVLLGMFYFVIAATLGALLLWRAEFARRQRRTIVGLSAAVGAGIASYSYFVGTAGLGKLNGIAPFVVIVVVLVLTLAAATPTSTARVSGLGLAVFGLWCVVSILVARHAWVTNLRHSALLGGPSVVIDDVRAAARQPVANPTAPDAVDLLRRSTTSDKFLVLLPDYSMTTEVLLRAQRGQLLPMSDPYQESFLPDRVRYLRELAGQLPSGTRFLSHVDYYARSQSQPPETGEVGLKLLHEIRSTHAVRVVAEGRSGFRIYELGERL